MLQNNWARENAIRPNDLAPAPVLCTPSGLRRSSFHVGLELATLGLGRFEGAESFAVRSLTSSPSRIVVLWSSRWKTHSLQLATLQPGWESSEEVAGRFAGTKEKGGLGLAEEGVKRGNEKWSAL